MFKMIVMVGLGGALGSLLRYATGVWMSKLFTSVFPFATFTVNIVGCFLIGLLYAYAEKHQWFNAEWRLLLITGFCGGLTTFSTFAYENIKLLQAGQTTYFILYTLGSFILALLAVIAGVNSLKLV